MTAHAGNRDESVRQNPGINRHEPHVAFEAARVRRLVNGGDAGRDAHTRALGGRLTMDLFRSKLIRLKRNDSVEWRAAPWCAPKIQTDDRCVFRGVDHV